MANFSYIVGNPAAGSCFLVDPSWDIGKIEAEALAAGLKIEACILTHGHYDHSMHLEELARRLKVPVYLHAADLFMMDMDNSLVTTFSGGAVLTLAGIEVTAVPTPGHSPGSVCLIAGGNIFTGDTLFIGACGRVDLPGSDPKSMTDSLRRVAKLDPELIMWPGHDYGERRSVRLGDEVRLNPYIKFALRGITP